MLERVEKNEDKFGTVPRMKGMLTMARDVRRSSYAESLTGPDG